LGLCAMGSAGWECHDEGGTLAGLAVGGDFAAVMESDFADDGEAHAGAFVFVTGVETLEDVKNAVQIFFVEADAIVADGDFQEFAAGVFDDFAGGDFDDRGLVGAAEFEGVADEVLQQLAHLEAVGLQDGQVGDFDAALNLFDAAFEVFEDFAGDGGKVDLGEGVGLGGEAGEGQEVADEDLHASGGLLHALDVIAGFGGRMSPHFSLRRSPKTTILRRGSCKSWEAT